MSIPLNGAGKYKQGVYKPIHPEKYIGKEFPLFRSGLELSFFLFCDKNEKIQTWGSENIIIPYLSLLDNKVHKYYVDSYITIKEGNTLKKYLIEIKPKKYTLPPVFKSKQKEKTKVYETRQWIQNQSKWAAAKKWVEARNKERRQNDPVTEFLLLTEENLTSKKI